MVTREHCSVCGYTWEDQQQNLDHHLCSNSGKAPWEIAKNQCEFPQPGEIKLAVGTYQLRIAELESRNAELEAGLRKLEWSREPTGDWLVQTCPACHQMDQEQMPNARYLSCEQMAWFGHKPDCWLDKLLKGNR
jgi:hypothetical protein